MHSAKFSNSLSTQCSTCGGTAFEYETEIGPFKCVGCERYFEKDELMRENGELIESGVEELAPNLIEHARDELRKAFRKTVSGSKHLKLK